jgi:hypothetical protein
MVPLTASWFTHADNESVILDKDEWIVLRGVKRTADLD